MITKVYGPKKIAKNLHLRRDYSGKGLRMTPFLVPGGFGTFGTFEGWYPVPNVPNLRELFRKTILNNFKIPKTLVNHLAPGTTFNKNNEGITRYQI